MTDTTCTILLVVEGNSDARRLPVLIDAWIGASVDWATLDTFRAYRHVLGHDALDDETPPYLPIKDIPRLARDSFGGFRGDFSGGGDQGLLRKLEQLLIRWGWSKRPDAAVVWGRDTDQSPGRRAEAADARERLLAKGPGTPHLLRAVAEPCGEAWVLLGWLPADTAESARHARLVNHLGFDPVLHPTRTSSKGTGQAPAPSKDIVAELTSGSADREVECLCRAAGLDDQRTEASGLADLKRDVSTWMSHLTGASGSL